VPEEAAAQQPRNFLTHVISLAFTKTGDGLADPKLVLSWLLAALGSPALFVGLLVPVREAGSLLPQLVTAGFLRRLPQRKWAWAAGSVVQGMALAGMGLSALWFDGESAGLAIVGLLAVFAVARSVCSVTYKDVLGRTVSKATRGTATGTAATVSAVAVFAFGALLAVGVVPRTVPAIASALFSAAALWLVASALFATLVEAASPNGDDDEEEDDRQALGRLVAPLRDDPQLVRFIIARGLLTATALAPPYMLAMGQASKQQGPGDLGPVVIASSSAAMLSTYIWGRLADRSSRQVLVMSGFAAAVVLLATAAVGWLSDGHSIARWLLPVLLFVLMVSYQGVRLGRSTHIVDMANEENRAAYTALSNTLIGVLLLVGGVFALVAQFISFEAVLVLFAVMSGCAGWVAWGLHEVQRA